MTERKQTGAKTGRAAGEGTPKPASRRSRRETTAASRAAAGKPPTKATGTPRKTPEQRKLKSDVRFRDADFVTEAGESRKNFSTKISPALIAKVNGIVLMSKMRGVPRGADSVVAVVQEALARYVEEIEKGDQLEIPIPYGS